MLWVTGTLLGLGRARREEDRDSGRAKRVEDRESGRVPWTVALPSKWCTDWVVRCVVVLGGGKRDGVPAMLLRLDMGVGF